MRFYNIVITQSGGTKPFIELTSHPGGTFDPAALNVEFDMPIAPYNVPTGAMALTIHGVPLVNISQAYKLVGMNIAVYGGMKQGLPLANPLQSGMLLQGQIWQAFGNWEGTDMRLDLIIYPPDHSNDLPGNFVLNWLPGQSLADTLKATLSIVYPSIPVSMNIGSNLVFDSTKCHFCATVEQLSQYIGDLTEKVFQQRVTITLQGGKFIIFDKTYKPSPIQIVFTDLIGQPTWIATKTMQMKTVMRADLQIGSVITMPKGLQNGPGFVVAPSGAALSSDGAGIASTNKNQSTFQNNFTIASIRHIGSYRSPAGEDWATVFDCVEAG
ncbi:hypothetical protein [Dyella acidiphila]|uniref:Minor tail protein n=1 Tax=Dyella acidiphila TaxID=2775866 RepID=A0ABR9G6F8_9GAMM|nr:hypothetical protein [Dyella acidiphila]MBE1159631.1 hypothetical protein [Dyella acidiphila]